MMERRFARDVGALEAVFDFVREFLAGQGLDESHAFDLDLVIEELFTNMVRHNRDGTRDIAVGLEREGSTLTVTLRDFGVARFDVTRVPEADIDQPLSARPAGGLGLHLVRRLADSLQYDHRDGDSILTATLRLER